jgi:purine-cytosine permease-like protein
MDTEQQSQQTQAGSEFEREPVPKSARLGFKSFIGMYAGEHCAGTELMIGPLFVAAGVSAYDLVMGLLLGNALAVLSWMFLCAPIATRSRLTLYYQLEKICGRKLVTLYNLANGVMFCFLAGAMVTVSATAVGVWFKFPMPGLNDLYPNSVGWVVAVAAVGGLIAIVAAYGYQTVAKFANVAAPWMVLVFLAFGFVGLRQFIDATGEINSLGDVVNLAKTEIWKGGDPQEGQVKFTFWHVTFFAWFCNMAMHIGMSDLSVFRFAKKSWYGVASSTGMYVGHFMAWISASILYAYQLHLDPADTDVLPGPLAFRACGLAGLICVIIAGWTTANPTIYRAGLAFQAISPKSSRFKVTLLTGAIATLSGMFPAIAMKLLGFVALYGLVLMPMGAVIFVDYWLIRKFGLQSNYAEVSKKTFNIAAGLAWFVTFGICVSLVLADKIQIYFVSLPGWFMAAAIYVVVSAIYQHRTYELPLFRTISQLVSWISLGVLTLLGILFLAGSIGLDQVKWLAVIVTIVWFASASLWMWKDNGEES